MKKNHVAIVLGLAMSASLLSGCGSGQSGASNDTETIYGEVSKVNDDGITIEVGTMKESTPGDPGKQSPDDSKSTDNQSTAKDSNPQEETDNKKREGGEAPSMLDKTGEEKKITVSSDTEITKESKGGPGQGGPGQGGEAPSGNAPSGDTKSDGESSDSTTSSDSPEEIKLSDISEGDIVSVSYDADGTVDKITVMMSANGEMGGEQASQAPDSYESVKEYTEDTTKKNKTVKSEGTDENAIHAYNNAEVSLSNYNITRASEDSQGGDNSSFYGVGAAVLESDGTMYLKDSTIETDSKGAAGIFAYNDGTVYTADTKITTTQDTSGGIHVAGGGKLYAWDMDVETSGESSAAIRSDRGGGEMVVNGGSYTSNGTGSPAIYSTADIAVNKADLTANGSEAVCIEGLNSVHLFNSNLTGNMSDNEQNDCTWNVILYQSMSGDSEVGNSTFEMDGGTLTAKNGGMFYTTNTESTITLSDVDITYADDNDFFVKCTGNSNQRGWGTSGDNGADCLFTAVKQEMKGDIVWDSISQLDFYMTDGSTLKGAVTDDESNAGDGGDGYCNMYIEKGSTWTVTGDSTLTSLQNAGTIIDESGKTVTIKGTDGTVYMEGESEYTITVGSYKNSADTSGASKTSSWSDYKLDRPSNL